MQLVAYGAQDIYLTGNPQITFFKVVYRRHTNFSMECIDQTLNGAVAANSEQLLLFHVMVILFAVCITKLMRMLLIILMTVTQTKLQ